MYRMAEGQRYKHDRDPKSEKFICQSGEYDVFFETLSAKKLTGFITIRDGGVGQPVSGLSEIHLSRTGEHEPWTYRSHKHWQNNLGGTATAKVIMDQALEAFNAAFTESFGEPGKVTLGDALDRMSV